MKKLLRILKGFGLSFLFIVLGIYILNTTDSIFGTIIGIANIVFFGVILLWAMFKMYKDRVVK
jgi:hypothetical protein